MEEDIKLLKSIPNPEQPLDIEIQIAIENILNRLEQDERVIEEMAKWIFNKGIDETEICDYEKCLKYKTDKKPLGDCNKCIIDHFRKKCE